MACAVGFAALGLLLGGVLWLTGRRAGSAVARGPAAVTVTIDLTRPMEARSEVGFLHGLSESEPSVRWIAPLRPALWRGTPASADILRATSIGARYTLVVSDLWGYPGAGWYGRQPPWQVPGAWQRFVDHLVRVYRGRQIIWDIWNEPDHRYFWNGTREQYFEVYRLAYAVIRRAAGPRATVAGPSVATFRWNWLEGLVDYCRARRCEVNALTWHELPGATPAVTAIAQHLRRARRELLQDPARATVRLREIDVNETVDQEDQLAAGEQVGYLAALALGGADASARACWRDPCGVDNCNVESLGGLLDPLTGRPRAPWWAMKWYARGVASRVRSASTDAAVAALAAVPTRRHAEILLGYLDTHDRPLAPSASVRLRLRGLKRLAYPEGHTRFVVTEDVVHSTSGSLAQPQRCQAPRTLRVRGDVVDLAVHAFGLHDAMLVKVDAWHSQT
jgi:xylan 1,4-beta-xylosidase